MGCTLGKDAVKEDNGNRDFQSNLVMQAGSKQFSADYIEGESLGEGITGTVKIVTHRKTLENYAMKTINLSRVDKAQLNELQNEINILRQLDHPNIVRLMSTYQDKKNIFLIMELCTGGELAKRRLNRESEVLAVVSQITKAIRYCHQRGVCHRDLKLENIIFASKDKGAEVKLIDFGLSATFITRTLGDGEYTPHTLNPTHVKYKTGKPLTKQERMFLTACGTAYYMAPEVLQGGYSEACDLWSIGVITFMLLTGRPPFDGANEEQIFRRLQRAEVKYTSPVWAKVSSHARSFVEHLLQVDPEERWTAEQALNSPWLSRHCLHRTQTDGDRDLERSYVESMKKFCGYPRLKKAAYMIVAHHQTQTKIADLRNAFLVIDNDNSGAITYEELEIILLRNGIAQQEEIRELFESLDQDRSGKIRYLEFLASTIEALGAVDAGMFQVAFEHLDEDNSGYITSKNLQQLMGKGFTQKDVTSIIKECDLTGDNKVSKAEFLQIMAQQTRKTTTRSGSVDLTAFRESHNFPVGMAAQPPMAESALEPIVETEASSAVAEEGAAEEAATGTEKTDAVPESEKSDTAPEADDTATVPETEKSTDVAAVSSS